MVVGRAMEVALVHESRERAAPQQRCAGLRDAHQGLAQRDAADEKESAEQHALERGRVRVSSEVLGRLDRLGGAAPLLAGASPSCSAVAARSASRSVCTPA